MTGCHRPRISVLVPTREEAGNIDRLLHEVLALARMASLDLEVIVIDDGSRDGTRELVRAWETTHPVTLIARDGERGLATAVLAGACRARGDVVVVMDADFSHPPERIGDLAGPILDGSSDMVIGSRYVPGGSTPGWALRRRIASRAAASVARIMTDARDPLSGFFAIRRDLLLEAGRNATGFKIGLEVLLRAGDGLRVKEVPIAFKDRSAGRSKLDLRVMMLFLKQLAHLAGCSAGAPLVPACLAGIVVDLCAFHAFLAAGESLAYAHVAALLLAFVPMSIILSGCIPRSQSAAPPGTLRLVLALGTVALLSASLRGGLLGIFVRGWGWHPSLALLPAMLIGWAVVYIGCAFLVFSTPGSESAARRRAGAVAALVYVVVLRLAYMNLVDLIPQEAYYWNYSQHMELSFLDHPPMTALLIRVGSQLFGHTELAVRMGAVSCWGAAAVFSYLLARNLVDRSAAFRVLFLLGALPFFFGMGFLMTPDAPVVAFWAGSLHFLERALIAGKGRAWIGVGVCLGLGLISKYPILLLCPAALLFVLMDSRSRRWLLRPEPYLALVIALVLFAPVILWNYQNDWVSFRFQSVRRLSAPVRFELPELLGSMILLVTPLGLMAFWLGIRKRRPALVSPCGGAAPALESRGRLFVLAFTLVPLAIFVLASLRSETKFQWTGPVWLAGLPAMALGVLPGPGRVESWLAVRWRPALVGLVALYGVGLHVASFGLPGIPLPTNYYFMSWKDLGRQVEDIELEVIEQTGAEPLIVGLDKYHLSSELAFYDPALDGAFETAGMHLFHKASLMYALWFPEATQAGKSLVLVSPDRKDMTRKDVLEKLERLEPVRELTVRRGDSVVGTYYARVGHGYRPGPEF